MKKDNKSKKKNTGASLAVWIVIALFLLIVFIVYSPKIKKNLQNAKKSLSQTEEILPPEELITEDIKENQTVKIDLHDKSETKKEDSEAKKDLNKENADSLLKTESKEKTEELKKEESNKEEAKKTQTEKVLQKEDTSKKESVKKENDSSKTQEVSKSQAKSESSKSSTIDTQLCFMTVSSNGTILRKQVSRKVSRNSPLKDAITALLAGPNLSEQKNDCQSFISNGTRLLGLSISNGVAVLNFSEEFEFNQFGIEGIRCQLQQIVYTATAFSTVKSVQFLIEGEKRQFVNSESSCYIGSPLSRNSF